MLILDMILRLIIALIINRQAHIYADLYDYSNTVAHFAGDAYLNTLYVPKVYTEFKTSRSYMATTDDHVYITFVGDFSSSGPHNVGSFQIGQTQEVTTQLDRVIGDLRSVVFQKNGTDGWLLGSMRCRINLKHYEFESPTQWLDNFDPDTFAEHGNGYEPLAQSNLPASSQMQLLVTDVLLVH